MRILTVKVTTVGVPGSATGQGSIVIAPPDRLQGIRVKYNGQPNTCNVVISNEGNTILTLATSGTDFPLQGVGQPCCDDDGVPTQLCIPPRVSGAVVVDVTDGDAAVDAVEVGLLFDFGHI